MSFLFFLIFISVYSSARQFITGPVAMTRASTDTYFSSQYTTVTVKNLIPTHGTVDTVGVLFFHRGLDLSTLPGAVIFIAPDGSALKDDVYFYWDNINKRFSVERK